MTDTTSRGDPARLAELQRLLILDTPRQVAYDELIRQLATALDVPMTMINLLDERRDWFKAAVGLTQPTQPVDASLCEVFLEKDLPYFVVEDLSLEPRYATNPLVVNEPHIRFYAAARLAIRGQTVGTLCACDVRPRQVTAAQIQELQLMAHCAMQLMLDDAEASKPD